MTLQINISAHGLNQRHTPLVVKKKKNEATPLPNINHESPFPILFQDMQKVTSSTGNHGDESQQRSTEASHCRSQEVSGGGLLLLLTVAVRFCYGGYSYTHIHLYTYIGQKAS